MKQIHQRQDFYFKKAKQEYYPARSVYKLKELDQKYRLLREGDVVLDLGAAPGSWMMYASKIVGNEGRVIGIDIQQLKILLKENMTFIQGDITNSETLEKIKRNKFDVVLSDMAPKTTGIKVVDTERSLELSKMAFNVALLALKNGGNFVFKIFESDGADKFVKDIRRYFKLVKRIRPQAVRKKSKEIYIVCKNFR